MKRKSLLAVLIMLVLGVTLFFGAEQLTIYHWWTAGGEAQAISKLFDMFHNEYPSIQIVPNPIVGGGGTTLRTVLMGLLAAGMPPDTFQSLSGADLRTYVEGNYLKPVDDIWQEEKLDETFPKILSKMVMFNGHHYAIPMSIHRANWLFYNKKLFDELGLTPPTNIDELLDTCKIIKEKRPDLWPISLGTRDKFTAVFLFDDILLSTGGPDVYEKYYTGQLDVENNAAVRKAFEYYAKLVPYIYPYHSAQTWDQALGRKDWVMMAIGDFAVGYMIATNRQYGVDWGAVAFPKNVFLMIVDTFTYPQKAKDPDATIKWLKFITQPLPEQEFTVLKGSIAPNKNVPSSVYPDAVRQQDVVDFHNVRIVPSSIHGVLAPEDFLSEYQDILINFLYSPNVDRVLRQVSDAMKFYNVKESSAWYWQE